MPLQALLAYNVWQTAQREERQALQSVENLAAMIAHDAGSFVDSTTQYLTIVAQRPSLQAMDPARCDPVLEDAVRRHLHFANVLVTDLVGQSICSSVRGPGQVSRSFSSDEWFRDAVRSGGTVISKPFHAPIAQKTVLAFSQPVQNDLQRVGTVSVLVDLASLQRQWDRLTLPAGSRLSLLDDTGSVLVTRPDFDRWVGKDARRVRDNAMAANPGGTGITKGIDGVERVFAIAPVPFTGWSAVAALPVASVFAGYHSALQRSIAVSVAVVAAVFLLAIAIARRLSRPLAELAHTAQSVAAGNIDARADESVPGEFRTLALEFNAMLETRARFERRLRESERRYADLLGNVDMASLMLDREGHVTYCNDFLLMLTGWRRDEIVGQDWMSRFVPEPQRAMVHEALLANAEPTRLLEYELPTRFGETRLVRWHNSVLRSPDGDEIGVASLGEDVTQLRLAAIRERRQMDFYAALSRTNGAIVRMTEPARLYHEICGICVENGHASMAYVSLREDDAIRPVAWAGPAEDFLQGSGFALGSGSPERHGPTAVAVQTGRRCVINDCESDPATAPWRERAKLLGTQAVAAFPFLQGERVVGALTLHTATKGFFDAKLIELIEEMTRDISFALDNHSRVADREAALRRAKADNERFHTVFQTAPVSMTVSTMSDALLLDANEAYCRFSGLSRDELVGQCAFDQPLWPDDAARSRFVAELLAARRVRNFELPLTLPSGERRDFLLQADTMEFQEVPCVLTIATDITELRRAQRDVLEREQQLFGLVDTAMDAIVAIDGDQTIRLFNRAAVEMFGVPASEALGSSIDRLLPERLRAAHRHHVDRFARTGGTARRMGAPTPGLWAVRGNGEEFPIEASISRLGDGESVLLTAVVRDVTELRKAEQARLAHAVAESASRAKTEFLSRMSHELRTPLNAILGFSQLLRSDRADPLSAGQQPRVELILKAGWHLLSLINDVLEVSRIEGGHVQLECRSVDLADVLDDVVRLSEGMAAACDVEIVVPYRSAPRLVAWADPMRLRQVMLNVVSNSIKYNRAGGRVEISLAPRGAYAEIEVADTGIGMTQEQLGHLYEPFNRLGRERGDVEGTGLGLALSRQLAELMRGSIDIQSRPGEGTRVLVALELATEHAAGAAPALEASVALATQRDPRGVVLYVEDSKVNLLLVQEMLKQWPEVTLLQAETGRDGLMLARSAAPDLVLLDMRLPDMTGEQVLAALRAEPATASLKVYALSASAMPDEVAAAREAGANDYWTKPLDVDRFMRELSRVLADARAG